MKIRLMLLAIFSIIASGCSSNSGGSSDEIEKKVTITFNNKEKTMLVNDSFDMFTELTLENVTKEEVVWLNDNPKIIRLDGNVAEAVGEGETFITAKVKNTAKQTTIKLIVRQQILKFTQKEFDIVNSNSFDLNEILELKGIGAGNLIWSSGDEDILSVNKGVINLHKEGVTRVGVQVKGSSLKDDIKITVKKNEIESIVFPSHIIEMYAMSNVEIPFKVIPEGASTAGIKWEIDNYSPIMVVAPGVLYSDQLGSGDLIVTLPNGVKTEINIRVVSKGLLGISAPLGTKLKIYEGNQAKLYLKLLPLGETYAGVDFIVDNPIITINKNGDVLSYPGKRGIANVIIRSKENPNVQLTMEVEVRSFAEYVYTDFNLIISQTENGLFSGEGQINVWRYFSKEINVKDFILYNGDGRVLYEDNQTYALDKVYKIKFNRIKGVYAEFTLTYQGLIEKKRVYVTPR